MAARLPAWLFFAIALILMGFAQYPLIRVVLKLDMAIRMPMSTMVMLMIGGLMCGLSAMILLVRRQAAIQHRVPATTELGQLPRRQIATIHAGGLLLLSGVPFANFMLIYHLWLKYRHQSPALDNAGIQALNFCISVYLYLLLSLFMVIAVIGLISSPLLIVFYLLCVVFAVLQTLRGKAAYYPLNIPIIQSRLPTAS